MKDRLHLPHGQRTSVVSALWKASCKEGGNPWLISPSWRAGSCRACNLYRYSKRQQKANSWNSPTASHADLWQKITFALHKSLCLCTAEWLPIFNVLWQGRLGLEPFGPAARSLLACSAVWVFLLSVSGDIPRFLRCLFALNGGTAAVTRDAQSILYGSAVVMLHAGRRGKLIYCWVRCICLTLALGPGMMLLSLARWVVTSTRSLLPPSLIPYKQKGKRFSKQEAKITANCNYI